MFGSRLLALTGGVVFLLSSALAAETSCATDDFKIGLPPAAAGQAVSDAGSLAAALQQAQGGETFLLAPGDYGALNLRKSFQSPVVIRSANPDKPACFTGLNLKGSRNVTLEGLYFDYTFREGDPHFTVPFKVSNSENIKITHSVLDGDYAYGTNSVIDGKAYGIGLRILESNNVQVIASDLRKWWAAVLTIRSGGLVFADNQIHIIRSDGIDIDAATGLTIASNHFFDFQRAVGSKDHSDMIQIMRVTPRGSSDIVIRDNIFDVGRGDYTQTIWAGQDGKDINLPVMRHRNVLVENNMIYNAHIHGISIHGSDNISIRKNSLIHVPGGHSSPAINISSDSSSVVIEQNVTSQIIGYEGQRDWVVLNNAIVQSESPSKNGFYDSQFIYYALGKRQGYNEYGVRPGSLVDSLKAGSTLSESYPTQK